MPFNTKLDTSYLKARIICAYNYIVFLCLFGCKTIHKVWTINVSYKALTHKQSYQLQATLNTFESQWIYVIQYFQYNTMYMSYRD